jgi:hypothetical protein
MKYKYHLTHNLKVVGSNPTPATKKHIKKRLSSTVLMVVLIFFVIFHLSCIRVAI